VGVSDGGAGKGGPLPDGVPRRLVLPVSAFAGLGGGAGGAFAVKV